MFAEIAEEIYLCSLHDGFGRDSTRRCRRDDMPASRNMTHPWRTDGNHGGSWTSRVSRRQTNKSIPKDAIRS